MSQALLPDPKFCKQQKIVWNNQFFGPLQNVGSGITAWQVNKEFLASIEICQDGFLLDEMC